MPLTYRNRTIIWESKGKQFLLLALCVLFTAGAIWTRAQYSFWGFWGQVLFWGGGGTFWLGRLLNPRNLFVRPGSALGRQLEAEQRREYLEGLGAFHYDETGFGVGEDAWGDDEECWDGYYAWEDIETAVGYKRDRYVVDEICLALTFTDARTLLLTEETPGWPRFLERLAQHLPAIPASWVVEITVPAFEPTPTLLFDRQGRTLAQLTTAPPAAADSPHAAG